MSSKIYYSVSTLRQMAVCPARVFFRRLAKEGVIKTDPSLPFIFGIAAHEGVEALLKNGESSKVVANKYVKDNLLDKYTVKNLQEVDISTEDIQGKQAHLDKCLDNFENKIMPRLVEANPSMDWADRVEVRYEAAYRNGVMVGVIDLDMDHSVMDWKSGKAIPDMSSLMTDPQPPTYHFLKTQTQGSAPSRFSFVYLIGKPTRQVQDGVYKSGPRKGQPKMALDYENGLQFKFDVLQDEAKVAKMFNDYIDPWAEMYEAGIIYKNPGYNGMNCKGCSYRTACQKEDYQLPKRPDLATKDPNEIDVDLLGGE